MDQKPANWSTTTRTIERMLNAERRTLNAARKDEHDNENEHDND